MTGVTGNTVQHKVPNSSGTEPPALKAPANAADCHIHITIRALPRPLQSH